MKLEVTLEELPELLESSRIRPAKTISEADQDGDLQCLDCERFFVTKQALATHRGRIHKVDIAR